MPNIPRFKPNLVHRVEMLAYPAVQILDVTGPLQVFTSANEIVAAEGRAAPYAITLVAKDGASVVSSAGLGLTTASLPEGGAPDTLMVAGGPGVEAAAGDPALLSWLQARAAQAGRVASVCTGAFLLAAAGLLDGRRAVTHWSYCGDLARRFPQVTVEPDPIFLRDGPIWTSAGVTAGIDLALALVEADLGRATALAVARYLVVFLKRAGGQAQFSAALALQAGEDRFAALHEWIGAHLAGDLSLPVLARMAGMSERSFVRHYASATGMSPARAVEKLRLEAAQRLLLETTLPLKRICQRCGFGSEETLRRSFLRCFVVTPQEYRARFGA